MSVGVLCQANIHYWITNLILILPRHHTIPIYVSFSCYKLYDFSLILGLSSSDSSQCFSDLGVDSRQMCVIHLS